MTREDIQREINAAAEAGGGEVVLPAGTHMLDGALHLKNGVTLRGASEQTLLVTDDKEVNFIVLDPGPDPGGPAAQNVKISDLFLKGPGTDLDDITQDVSSSPVQGCGILASARQKPGVEEVVQNIVIERCRIENMSGCGIRFDTREDVLMKDITVRQCRLHQNRRAPDPPPPPGSGLPAPDSYKDIYFYGRRFENITLEGNTCTFTPTAKSAYGNDSGIAFVMNTERGEGFVRNIVYKDNTCSGHRRHGLITSYGNLATINLVVSGNTCENNRWMGLYVQTNFVPDDVDQLTDETVDYDNFIIEDNVCMNNGYGGIGRAPGTSVMDDSDKTLRGGIVLNGCYKARLRRNRCENNGKPSAGFSGTDESKRFAAGIRVRGIFVLLEENQMQGNLDDTEAGGLVVKQWTSDDAPGQRRHRSSTIKVVDRVAARTGEAGPPGTTPLATTPPTPPPATTPPVTTPPTPPPATTPPTPPPTTASATASTRAPKKERGFFAWLRRLFG